MASILYRNGVIHSPADPFAEALLVEDGVVAWLGADDSARSFVSRAETVVDLDGALVTPAFVDAHVHLLSTGMALEGLDLSLEADVTTATSAFAAVANRVRDLRRGETPSRGPLVAWGCDTSAWPDAVRATRSALDGAAEGAPVVLVRPDLHSSLASTAVCERLGLDRRAGWDDEGWLTGDAHESVMAELRADADARHRELTDHALRLAASRGIASVHEHSLPSTDTRAGLADLIARTRTADSGLPLVVGYRGELCETTDDVHELLTAVPGLTGVGGDMPVDGSVGSHTAALTSPYVDLKDPADPLRTGVLELTTEQVCNHVLAATRAGVQAGFHVIGNRAMSEVVLGFQAAADLEGLAAIRGAGHRLEHAEMIDASALAAIVLMGVRLSVQPAFDAVWGGPGGLYEKRLGKLRAEAMNPLADLAGAGVPLALGSDTPVTPFDPWGAVSASLFLNAADQRISARAAFRAHTRGGWRLAGLDHTGAGEIRVGAPAHLALWRAEHLGVQGPHTTIAAWSTDARSGTPLLPSLGPDEPAPTCLQTLRDGVVIYDTLG